MRIILFTGKGGVGKTTTSAATGLRLADRGMKTLLVSTDGAHSLSDALGVGLSREPTEVAPGLKAVEIDTQRRFEVAWRDVQQYLLDVLAQGGLDPITAEELTVLPGIDEVLALLAVHELAQSGEWDVLIVDCAATAETLRLLALPEALGWYLSKVFPLHRNLARGMRPLASILGRRAAIPSDAAFGAIVRLAEDLAAVREMLADPAVTSVRLVLTPEAVVTAEARRMFTALSLYGYQVDEVVANRVFPLPEVSARQPSATGDGRSRSRLGEPNASDWQRAWVAAQREQLDFIADSFAGLSIREAAYRPAEPVGLDALRQVADDLYDVLPGHDPAAPIAARPLLTVTAVPNSTAASSGSQDSPMTDSTPVGAGREFVLTISLPLAAKGQVEASRSGDDLVVTVSGHRRVLTLPSALRRCSVSSGSVSDGLLSLRFVPDPNYWRRQ
ncbi:ArsA family ATPase [Jatrophihabitans sp. DSM 45814]